MIAYTDWHEALKEKVVPDRCCQEHYQNCGRNYTNMFWNRVSRQRPSFVQVLLFFTFGVFFVLFFAIFCPRLAVENVLNKQDSEDVMSNRRSIQMKAKEREKETHRDLLKSSSRKGNER